MTLRTLPGIALAIWMPISANGTEDVLVNRPAFSLGDQPASSIAACNEVRPMATGLDYPGYRIDLSVIGAITSIRSDGLLWYITICNLPDVRLMCVTYKSNDMKVGDRVNIKGGYNRVDGNHIMLDPCLANWPDQKQD